MDELKERIIDVVKTSDDVPTEEQNRFYDITVGALIAEGDVQQIRNEAQAQMICELLEENEAITTRMDNLQFCLDHCAETTRELEQKLEEIRSKLLELIEHGYIKHCVTDIMEVLDK